MVESMKNVAKLNCDLTVEERNLLSVGYKNVIGARRASWRIMSSIEQKEESKGNDSNVKLIKGYRQKVEEELSKICKDILSIIDDHLIPSSASGEATVFYYKMWVMLAFRPNLLLLLSSILQPVFMFCSLHPISYTWKGEVFSLHLITCYFSCLLNKWRAQGA